MRKTACKKIEFQLAVTPGSKVSVAGTFNDWDPERNPMKDNPDSGHYKTVVAVPPGKHEYKFVVNGDWCADQTCPESVSNCFGSSNSVLCV